MNTYSSVAFDLEFDSHRHSYGVTLCLIQVATVDTCYVIDPFSFPSGGLSALYGIFQDETIQKIVHSPGEDLRLLHSLGCFPKNLFDTEIPAKLLNYEQTSLAVLLQLKLGYSMSKGQQRSNWLRRPLSPEQIDYAAADVGWLHALKDVLIEEAIRKDLMSYVLEEQESLSTTIYQAEEKIFFLKPPDLYSLSPFEQHVLNSLFIYRDELARNLDKPAFQVMDESVVRSLASGTTEPHELQHASGVYGGFKNIRMVKQFTARLMEIHSEAETLGLSQALPVRARQSKDGQAARSQAARDKEIIFAPIQAALVSRFGESAARYLLSNGLVNDLLSRKISLGKLKHSYRMRLYKSIAAELNIDLGSYE